MGPWEVLLPQAQVSEGNANPLRGAYTKRITPVCRHRLSLLLIRIEKGMQGNARLWPAWQPVLLACHTRANRTVG